MKEIIKNPLILIIPVLWIISGLSLIIDPEIFLSDEFLKAIGFLWCIFGGLIFIAYLNENKTK